MSSNAQEATWEAGLQDKPWRLVPPLSHPTMRGSARVYRSFHPRSNDLDKQCVALHVQSSRKMWQQAFWQKSFVHVVGRSEEDNVGPSLPWSGTVQKMFQRPSVVERRSRHHLIELRHLYRRLRMNNNTLAIICDHMSLLCTIVLQENSHQFPHPSLFMPWRLSTGRHVGDLRGSVWNSSRADKTLN